MDVFVGYDAGGTRTRALVADAQGTFVGYACGGTGNLHYVSIEELGRTYSEALQSALKYAPSEFSVRGAFIGAAGVKADSDRLVVLDAVAKAIGVSPECVDVRNDSESALAGGLSGRPGIVLIVGTGSHAFGRGSTGTTAYCGGWGSLLDDIGSGYWLGLQALRITTKVVDGREDNSAIAGSVLKELGIVHPYDLLPRVYTQRMEVPEIAGLAPLVMACAEGGDARAIALLQEGVTGLTELVELTGRAIGASDASLEVVFAGGLAVSATEYAAMLRKSVSSLHCVSAIRAPELPPVCGSLLLAIRRAGVEPAEELIGKLRSFEF